MEVDAPHGIAERLAALGFRQNLLLDELVTQLRLELPQRLGEHVHELVGSRPTAFPRHESELRETLAQVAERHLIAELVEALGEVFGYRLGAADYPGEFDALAAPRHGGALLHRNGGRIGRFLVSLLRVLVDERDLGLDDGHRVDALLPHHRLEPPASHHFVWRVLEDGEEADDVADRRPGMESHERQTAVVELLRKRHERSLTWEDRQVLEE